MIVRKLIFGIISTASEIAKEQGTQSSSNIQDTELKCIYPLDMRLAFKSVGHSDSQNYDES